ncbi:MAG: VCBS repeat-containing protein [Planctomycetes bacterium]|nr:VCBS repeat-containing protein [Planctomycetota bacterium]
MTRQDDGAPRRRTLARSLLVAAALLWSAGAARADGYAESRVTLPGDLSDFVARDLNGDGLADLVVTSIAEVGLENERHTSVFYQRKDGAFGPRPDQTWRAAREAAVMVVGDLSREPGVEIGYLWKSGAKYYGREGDKYKETPRKFINTRTFFDFPSQDALPFWEHVRDLDGDGFEDLILPQPRNYQAFFQSKEGAFDRVQVFSTKVDTSLSSDPGRLVEATTKLPALVLADFNGDGRVDLITSYDDSLVVYVQQAAGGFPMQPTVAQPLSFLKEGFEKGTPDKYDTKFIELEDFDRDGKADLLVLRNRGEVGSFTESKTEVLFYRGDGAVVGRPHGDKTLPHQALAFSGIGTKVEFPDLNGDGKKDLAFTIARLDLLTGIKSGIFNEVTVTYRAFLFNDEKKVFSTAPDYGLDLAVPKRFFDFKRASFATPALLFGGDFTGDGKADLLRFEPADDEGARLRARAYGYTTSTGLFSGDTFTYESDPAVTFGFEPRREIKMLALNGDRRTDLIVPGEASLEVAVSK